MKKFLRKQPRAETLVELQAHINRFVAYYNEVRPHRAKARRAPRSAFEPRDKARLARVSVRHPLGLRRTLQAQVIPARYTSLVSDLR